MTLPETANDGTANPIRLTTPLGQAISKLFARALPMLEGNLPGSLKAFNFGGCAVHLLTHGTTTSCLERLSQKIYLMAQPLDLNTKHNCNSVPDSHPVVFLGRSQERVLLAPPVLSAVDFTTHQLSCDFDELIELHGGQPAPKQCNHRGLLGSNDIQPLSAQAV